MAKKAIVNGVRVSLDKAVALSEAAMPEEKRLFEASRRTQAERLELFKKLDELEQVVASLYNQIMALEPGKREELVKKLYGSKLFQDGKGEAVDLLAELLEGIEELGDEPPADEPPADEPPADEPPADEPPADEPPADEPPADDGVKYEELDRSELMELAEEAGFAVKKNTPTDRLIQWLKTGKGPVAAKKPSL